jgi:hypothetical protein
MFFFKVLKNLLQYFLLLFFTVRLAVAQNELKMYEWREHLSYNKANSVTIFNNKVYCAATLPEPDDNNNSYYKATHQGLFYLDLETDALGRTSRINGLSDVEPILVKTNNYNNTLFIAYQNSNIDIINGQQIINVSDINRKQILGSKKINNVFFKDHLAYLATGFGIVVINTNNGEVKDSYIIGPGGSYINVYECTLSSDKIYAATSSGLYAASLNGINLSNFQSWQLESGLPNGPYNSIINFKGKIITNYSEFLKNNSNVYNKDTLYMLEGNNWVVYPYKLSNLYPYTISKITYSDIHNRIIFIETNNFEIRDSEGNYYGKIWGYDQSKPLLISDIVFDGNYYWISDKFFGLTKSTIATTSAFPQNYQRVFPNSPNTYLANDIKFTEDRLLIAPIFLGDYPESFYLQEGIYAMENNNWKVIKKYIGGPFFDICSVAPDPENKNHFYAASYGVGILEFLNDSMINMFNCLNSPLPLTQGSTGSDTRVTSVDTDQNGNLWVAAAHTNKIINAREKNGTWHSINFNNSIIKSDEILVDKNDIVWVNTLDPSIILYKHDGSFNPATTSNSYTITTGDSEGKINASIIYCIREDKEGDMWVGTNKGIFVLYDTESIISNQKANPQQILIEENGVTKILLETEDVKCIAVDGANNKWIGTQKNGVFYISADGQKEIFHFTKENSPLFSDNIIEIAIHPKTGEVFISTEKGMLSFQNYVIEGAEKFDDIQVYPNPVKPSYSGPVMIKGLVNKSVLKITDIAGNLVYETTAEGGQVIWDSKTISGKKVSSGVYLVMCGTSDASLKAVAKIMIIN